MIPPGWAHLPFFTTDWPRIRDAVAGDARKILPPEDHRFAALDLTPPDALRVVILGQDPYPTPGHAMGLAFSVAPGIRPLPRTLSNIFKEIQADIGSAPRDGDLTFWARQGVLLLNTCLTVPAGDAAGHARLGWHRLTEQVLAEVSRRPCAFVLWGAHAQSLAGHIRAGDHLILHAAHPSPLSARRGFFGSRPFSRVNSWLTSNSQPPIDWAGDAFQPGHPGV
jgi:uracil-DNA glycosylase